MNPDLSPALYRLAADALLVLHAGFVAFIILGLALILIGKPLGWQWVRNPWFRWTHPAGIGMVVPQSWLGLICPLTTWEMALRAEAGDAVYSGSFIANWLHALLYYRAQDWVFIIAYTGFGALVLASWFWVRPQSWSRIETHHRQDNGA